MARLQLELAKDLPDGWTPLEVVSVIKCLDEDGDTALAVRTSGGLNPWETVGMLTFAGDSVRGAMTNDFRDES